MEENLKSKTLYKILLCSLKYIPMIIAFITLMNTILSKYDIDIPYFSYIVTYILIGFVYIAATVFRFCFYHRMFIHYFTLNLTLNIIDYEIGIPVSDRGIFTLYMAILGAFLFVVLYVYLKRHRKI